ncbi:MAG: hypothetical protein GY833_12475 [Aestuariibacter sp.]|nr:hypothetical protein [Aestuariibacter sp.]|tara:strand:+ start:82932 stop:84104 length:1173 start_codon:yes stop_codon:yes gene_type:complete
MLKVEGLFQINLTLDGLDDLETNALNLVHLELIEVAGVGLPMVQGHIIINEPHVRAKFHEGNKITVSYGIGNDDRDDTIDTRFMLSRVTATRTNHQYNVTFTGLYDAPAYLVTHKQRAFANMSAVEAILGAAKDHFGSDYIDSNISRSEDRMTWLQASVTDKKFIANTWMHADLPDSFPMIAVTTDGRFRLRDLKTMVKEEGRKPTWEFYQRADETDKGSDNKIWYHGDYVIDNNSGFMNHWLGYGNELDMRDQDLGEYEAVLEHSEPQLAKASSFPRHSEVHGRKGTPRYVNDNMYPRYWHAYQQNTTQLGLYSAVTVKFNYDSILHKNMRVLDLVYFAEVDSTSAQYDNPYTGLYIISKLSRKFNKNKVVTTVELSRETLTDIDGDVR